MEYLSCFLAIPLPKTYRTQFQQMQKWLQMQSPNFPLVHHETPHITLFYIGNCDQLVLDTAANIVCEHISLLLDTSVVLHGLDTFENSTTVLFLKAQPSLTIFQFVSAIQLDFSTILGLQSLPFKPHLTLTKCITEEAKRDFDYLKNSIYSQFSDTMFAFPITEVTFFAKMAGSSSVAFRPVLSINVSD